MADDSLCCIPGCSKPVRYPRSDLCNGHYLRKQRHGSPLGGRRKVAPPADGICTVEGCHKLVHGGGALCSMHAERLRRHGDVHKGAHKPRGKCSVDGCEKAHCGRGYCTAHYKRWKKYGDPLAGRIKHGEAQVWLREVAACYAGDDCLPWPFGRNRGGYGRVSFRGKPTNAHAVILECSAGPKPTPKHECCHRCGKGHFGCVNPRHMYWGTRKDNVADAIRHGTFSRPPIDRETGYRSRCVETVIDG